MSAPCVVCRPHTVDRMGLLVNIVVSLAASTVVGFGLWAVLPRGVVLTRAYADEPEHWVIRNESALPVEITKVTHRGVHTHNEVTAEIEVYELPSVHQPQPPGISLDYEDEVASITLAESGDGTWPGQVVPPGDTLNAHVSLNRDLRIEYRRAGRLGIFEKRAVEIHGGV